LKKDRFKKGEFMLSKKLLLSSFVAAIFAVSANATVYKAGTGSSKGNYFSMMNDVASEDYCGAALGEKHSIEVLNSGGSVDNLSGMMNKKFSIGIVQTDVLMSQAKKDPRRVNINRLKIIAGLHVETVHLLIPKGYQPKKASGGLFSKFKGMFGGDDNKPVQVSLDMLKNQDIASWGGSATSAKALSYFFGLNWNIVAVPEGKRDAISNMPILLVGGQPYAPVEKYLATGKYRLIGLNYKEIANKAAFYMPVEATYSINGKPMSVPSVGIQALMLGKSFRREARNMPMQELAKCIDESLPDLADDPNTNPNWNSVYELNEQGAQINWTYFPIK
jgi:hypothetical protein